MKEGEFNNLKVAEHSFQVPIPNSPFLQESSLLKEVFILAFSTGCVLLPWQQGWLKTRLK